MKFEPFEQMSKAWETWQTLAEASVTQATSFYDAMGKVEAKSLERAEAALAEATKLTKETLAYNAELAAEWRKLALGGLQRAAKAVAPDTDGSARA